MILVVLLLMEDILHRLGCINPSKKLMDISRISAINRMDEPTLTHIFHMACWQPTLRLVSQISPHTSKVHIGRNRHSNLVGLGSTNLPETNIFEAEMDGWKTIVSFWDAIDLSVICSRYLLLFTKKKRHFLARMVYQHGFYFLEKFPGCLVPFDEFLAWLVNMPPPNVPPPQTIRLYYIFGLIFSMICPQ